MQYNAIQYNTFNTMQCNECNAMQCSTIQYNANAMSLASSQTGISIVDITLGTGGPAICHSALVRFPDNLLVGKS
jgi:hypothetical protein